MVSFYLMVVTWKSITHVYNSKTSLPTYLGTRLVSTLVLATVTLHLVHRPRNDIYYQILLSDIILCVSIPEPIRSSPT